MTINTINKKTFELLNEKRMVEASLVYANITFNEAIISINQTYALNAVATGIWITYLPDDSCEKITSKIKVEIGGVITIRHSSKKKKYLFKKSAGWRLRFSLTNIDGEDILTIIPNVNWQKESHDYVLQLNEEFEKECDALLILHAVHCANCSLSMMTGGKVPALISI